MTHPAAHPAAETLASDRIGARVHALRTDRGLSAGDLAGRIALPEDAVLELEAGRRVPSIPTLYRLAAALRVAPGELLPPEGQCPRIEVHLPVTDDPDSSTARVIGGGPGSATQTYLFELRPGETDGGFDRHPGEELLVGVEGVVICSSEGLPDVEVRPGDSHVIDPSRPHALTGGGTGTARFVLVCTNPGPTVA